MACIQEGSRKHLNIEGITSIRQAKEIVVSLSAPSKMPCYGYSISALRCKVGSALKKIPGSVCSKCYALKGGEGSGTRGGWYLKRKVVREVFEKRFQAIKNPLWTFAMIYIIRYRNFKYFRWHDSGDLQSVVHLAKIVFIAKNTPDCLHWLPTREYKIVETFWLLNGAVPLNEAFPNLVIRLSAHMIDQNGPYELAERLGCTVSEVRTDRHTCEAMSRTVVTKNGQKKLWHGFCGECRQCWNQNIFNVSYALH